MAKLPKTPKHLTPKDYEFMDSLSSATLEIQSRKLHAMVLIFLLFFAVFLAWAHLTQIDEIARGQGSVIPRGQNQIVQNLEGGIISEIYVQEGEVVQKGDVLLRINNAKSFSLKSAQIIKEKSIQAKIARLNAQLNVGTFVVEPHEDEDMELFLRNEKKLFDSNIAALHSKLGATDDRLAQKRSELADARQRESHLRTSLEMINQEVSMTEPLVERGVRSKVEFLQLQRQANTAQQELNSASFAIERLGGEIAELQNNKTQIYQEFESKTREELNAALAELRETQANLEGVSDQVMRTTVISPQNGVVKRLFVNTIGGAVKPAQDLVEIVPTDEKLLVEVKIKPSDIAFIYRGQEAIVKFSAYDFAIYGGLKASVQNISPDTITEEKETYYLVTVETEKSHINRGGKELKIIPGMVADVDILTGKKSILDYILKPILKTTQYTFTER